MIRIFPIIGWIIGIAFCIGGVALLTLAMPIQTWRTGRSAIEPLALTKGGPEVGQTERIWVDTDAACGTGPRADPDDCFAIALLFKARGNYISGISTVFGNAALSVTDSTTRALLQQLRAEKENVIGIYAGAEIPSNGTSSPAATPAREALREALAKGPLTIVSLGPLTNIAAALDQRPDLQANVTALIAVMGHRPGHIFHPGEGAGGASWLGHGPVFRDFNFTQDNEAVARVVSMQVPLILIPYDAALNLAINDNDLAQFLHAGGPLKWIAERAAGWLAYWKSDMGQSGFYPFDLAAAAYVLHPGSFDCATVEARVSDDAATWTSWLYTPRALLVSVGSLPRREGPAQANVTYCPHAQLGLKQALIAELEAQRD